MNLWGGCAAPQAPLRSARVNRASLPSLLPLAARVRGAAFTIAPAGVLGGGVPRTRKANNS